MHEMKCPVLPLLRVCTTLLLVLRMPYRGTGGGHKGAVSVPVGTSGCTLVWGMRRRLSTLLAHRQALEAGEGEPWQRLVSAPRPRLVVDRGMGAGGGVWTVSGEE